MSLASDALFWGGGGRASLTTLPSISTAASPTTVDPPASASAPPTCPTVLHPGSTPSLPSASSLVRPLFFLLFLTLPARLVALSFFSLSLLAELSFPSSLVSHSRNPHRPLLHPPPVARGVPGQARAVLHRAGQFRSYPPLSPFLFLFSFHPLTCYQTDSPPLPPLPLFFRVPLRRSPTVNPSSPSPTPETRFSLSPRTPIRTWRGRACWSRASRTWTMWAVGEGVRGRILNKPSFSLFSLRPRLEGKGESGGQESVVVAFLVHDLSSFFLFLEVACTCISLNLAESPLTLTDFPIPHSLFHGRFRFWL